jgi:hypothetical protein
MSLGARPWIDSREQNPRLHNPPRFRLLVVGAGVIRISCIHRVLLGCFPELKMTLTRFVSKNVFRNKRRSILTVLSVGFSLLLLTMMMSIWRSFYVDNGSAQ